MTTDTITSVTLGVDLVKRLIQDHLNSQVLRCPHNVIEIDLVDETATVVLTLEPALTRLSPGGEWRTISREELLADLVDETATVVETYPERVYKTTTAPIPGQLNGKGNGHTADERSSSVSSQSERPEVTPAEPSKRHTYTPEEDAEILRLAAEGLSIDKIAAELGLTRSGVNYRITRARKADGAISRSYEDGSC